MRHRSSRTIAVAGAALIAAGALVAVPTRADARPTPGSAVVVSPFRPARHETAAGSAAIISALRFGDQGGRFVVRISGAPADSRCSFSAALEGVALSFDRTFACSRSFAHAGRVRPNLEPEAHRWTIRAAVITGSRRHRVAWVITVAGHRLSLSNLPRPSDHLTAGHKPTLPAAPSPHLPDLPTPTLPPEPTPHLPELPTTTTVPPSTTTTTVPPATTVPPTSTTQPGPTTTTTAPAPAAIESTNWSGYAAELSSNSVTEVGATWIVPMLNCSATPTGEDANWVGVDGTSASAPALFQTGVLDRCVAGSQESQTWWEDIQGNPPAPAQGLFAVQPGDAITASVSEVSPGTWRYAVTDKTTGQTATAQMSYDGPGASADYIEEDPSIESSFGSLSLAPLADFGTVSFSGLTLNGSLPPLSFSTDSIEIVQSGSVLASPSAPTSGGGFTVTYAG